MANLGEVSVKLSVDTATIERLVEIAKAAQVLTDLIAAFKADVEIHGS